VQADTSGLLARAEEERQFLKQLNDTLLDNQKEFQARAFAAVQPAVLALLFSFFSLALWDSLWRLLIFPFLSSLPACLADMRRASTICFATRRPLPTICPCLAAPIRCCCAWPLLQVRLKAAEERERQAAADKAAAVQDLQEQVRDLMVFLEARQAIEAAGAGGELEGGTVLPVPAAAEQQQQRRRGGGRGKRR
jgi:hypothetical protein